MYPNPRSIENPNPPNKNKAKFLADIILEVYAFLFLFFYFLLEPILFFTQFLITFILDFSI